MPTPSPRTTTPDTFVTAPSHVEWRLSSPDLTLAPTAVHVWRATSRAASSTTDWTASTTAAESEPAGEGTGGEWHTAHFGPTPTLPTLVRAQRFHWPERSSQGDTTAPHPRGITPLTRSRRFVDNMDTKAPNGEERAAPGPGDRAQRFHSPPPSRNPIADVWLYVLAFFIPPLAVALRVGCGFEVLLDIALWILCWIPGVIYAFYIIASRPRA
ncbi:hypothetical protein Q8F55_005570 [Vanrija albida]|uniref:Uncharacterized protein n=1 Tax=Vanrija albida TaxID=181172 RepID=A0ABR3Q2S9_9TREE